MKFSILLPSRNRAEYLDHAIYSVLSQDHRDFEIIVSDNASEPGYESLIRSIGDSRIRLYRIDSAVPVTDNWNAALERVSGDYVIMLGDDDALTPRLLSKLDNWAHEHESPDIIYLASYHYCYPKVMPRKPAGYFMEVRNSVFFKNRSEPFLLPIDVARQVARSALGFRQRFGFNAQHFVLSRSFIDSLRYLGPYYQSPYPDFYAAAVSFLKARSIVVVPQPLIIIGISPKSFGYYFLNKRETEGARFLHNEESLDEFLGHYASVALPGSRHNTCWLAAVSMVEQRLGADMQLAVDVRQYRRLQIAYAIEMKCFDKALEQRDYERLLDMLSAAERRFARQVEWMARIYRRAFATHRGRARRLLYKLLKQHFPPTVNVVDIGPHASIRDALDWLARRESATATLAQADKEVQRLAGSRGCRVG